MKAVKNIAIIGAGPSGLMAAEIIAKAGHRVTIYDHMASPGRKLLMAGRGGLNLTHSEPFENFLKRYNEAADWLKPFIQSFPPAALRAWCEELGQETFTGSSGRVFPKAMKAAPLLRAWLRKLDGLGVKFQPNHYWLGWKNKDLHFTNAVGETLAVKTDATLLALGGASWPRLGSDGHWTTILEAYGIALSPLRPANCGFSVPWSEYFSARFAGAPLKPVAFTYDGVARQGEAMITKQGLEGGLVYSYSAALRESIILHGKAVLSLDMRPGVTQEALQKKLELPRGSQSFSSYLRRAGLSPLAVALLREMTSSQDLNDAQPAWLAKRFKALPVTLTVTAPIARAISTAGGIKKEALDEHCMLRNLPGVFAAGEMLDWEAPTGGYLLQGCFSTAFAAANGIVKFCI